MIFLEADVARKPGLHFRTINVQTHIVVNLLHDFIKGVVSQLRINGGANGKNEVAERTRGKVTAQIDWNG